MPSELIFGRFCSYWLVDCSKGSQREIRGGRRGGLTAPSLLSTCHRRTITALIAVVLVASLAFSSPALAIEPKNVLVLYNADDGDLGAGFQIASHYELARPGVHLVPLTGINDILSGAYGEGVSSDDYLSVIRPQVLAAIDSVPDTIDVIVTTKGLPLRIDTGPRPAESPVSSADWERFSSLESELTRVDAISTTNQMGDQLLWAFVPPGEFFLNRTVNPYYNKNQPFNHAGSDPNYEDIRLTARLDGFSVQSVNAAIDRAQHVIVVPDRHVVIVDDDPTAGADQMVNDSGLGPGLLSVVETTGQMNVYENTTSHTVTAPMPVIGYISHGTNDGGGLQGGYIEGQLQFQLANGALFQTHESFNARSFDPSFSQTQGLVAEWLEIGGTAGLGHVEEPYNGYINVTNEDLLYQSLLPGAAAQPGDSGLTFVEAAWNATVQLSYVNTVVGDPLMTWQSFIPGDFNLDGVV